MDEENNTVNAFNVSSLLAAVLALIVGFAWITAANKAVAHHFPVRHHNDAAKVAVIYALLVTIFIIVVVYILNQTNKMYHTYTGGVFFNFNNFVWTNKSPVLNFWIPKNKKNNSDKKDNSDKDNSDNIYQTN